MSPAITHGAERLFDHGLDVVDGTLCLPADAKAAEVRAHIGNHALRFPLWLDGQSSLRDHLNASSHAPASSRFGPYGDNVLGMNWRLPSGELLRLGERVVKTTTGYDWLRFALHSGTRFGRAEDLVLRLRPACDFNGMARLDGSAQALQSCAQSLLHSPWLCWWDSVDWLHASDQCWLRVQWHGRATEAALFEEQLRHLAKIHGCSIALEGLPEAQLDGLPDLVLKTTPERVMALATQMAPHCRRTLAMLHHGLLHLDLGGNEACAMQAHEWAQSLAASLHELGGDWHSRWLPARAPDITESKWIQTLEAALHEA